MFMAGMMVFLGCKEYGLVRRIEEKIQAEQIRMEQVQAENQMGDAGREDADSQVREGAEGQSAGQEDADGQEGTQQVQASIRVLLTDNADSSCIQQQAVLQSSCGLVISGTDTQEYPADTPFDAGEFLQEGETIWVNPGNNVQQADSEASISVLSLEKSQGTPSYEGTLEIHRTADGYYIINQVDLETYLKYVVPSEMPSGYPGEALKAQAVCARTYAVRQMQEKGLEEYGADVDDTVSYQVYNNIDHQESTDVAVEDTRGQIMCWEGEPIQAYFFSTSCGFTSSDEVWTEGASAEYLRSIPLSRQTVETLASEGYSPDSSVQNAGSAAAMGEEAFRQFICGEGPLDYEREEPWYRWQVSIPWEELEKRAQDKYPQTGSILELEVGERSAGGAVTKLLIKGEAGDTVIENEYRIREFLSPGTHPVILQNGTANTSMRLLPSAYMFFEKISEDGQSYSLHIQGGGYGHGVGMSQNGAKYLAQDGMDWKQILSVFYKDITFESEVPE